MLEFIGFKQILQAYLQGDKLKDFLKPIGSMISANGVNSIA